MFQIYCDRGQGPTLEGKWGAAQTRFDALDDARSAAQHLAAEYPDCAWLICNEDGTEEYERLEPSTLNPRLLVPKFLMADDGGGGRDYVVHCHAPKFLLQIDALSGHPDQTALWWDPVPDQATAMSLIAAALSFFAEQIEAHNQSDTN